MSVLPSIQIVIGNPINLLSKTQYFVQNTPTLKRMIFKSVLCVHYMWTFVYSVKVHATTMIMNQVMCSEAEKIRREARLLV